MRPEDIVRALANADEPLNDLGSCLVCEAEPWVHSDDCPWANAVTWVVGEVPSLTDEEAWDLASAGVAEVKADHALTTRFLVKGIPGSRERPYAVGLFCRLCGLTDATIARNTRHPVHPNMVGLYSVPEIDLEQLNVDAREHYVKVHGNEGKTDEGSGEGAAAAPGV